MKILIVGTGAIGGFYAGKLHQAGVEISILARGDYAKIKADGIKIESIWGDFNFKPKNIYKNIDECQEKFDFVIVTTKVLPEISLKNLIAPALDDNSSIVLIQNGIFIEEAVIKDFPNHHLISVIAFIASERMASGVIKHSDSGKLTFGEYHKPNPNKTAILINLFEKSKVPCFLVADIQFERWKKLIWNAAFNPISVVAGRLDSKEILDNLLLKNLVRNVMLEVKTLAKAQGYEIELDFIEKTISDTHARATPSRTSTLIDFEAGKPLEIEAILGNSLRFAQTKSLNVPYMEALYALISGQKLKL
jgi:2-dehydropantoate 2-reductase